MMHPRTARLIQEVGANIQTWRLAQRMTASDCAERAGISRATLRNIETDPKTVQFRHIMAVLGVLGADQLLVDGVNPALSGQGQVLLAAAARREI